MINLNHVINEKTIQFNLENTSQLTLVQKKFVKSKSEDMQSVAKLPAYHHHTALQRGDYHA